jgi:hypothetical protein
VTVIKEMIQADTRQPTNLGKPIDWYFGVDSIAAESCDSGLKATRVILRGNQCSLNTTIPNSAPAPVT